MIIDYICDKIVISYCAIAIGIAIVGRFVAQLLQGTMPKLYKNINELILEIRDGKISALDEMFDVVSARLVYVARDYLFDKSKAEDVVSEVFAKLPSKCYLFDPQYNGFNWLYQITKNEAKNLNKLDSRYVFDESSERIAEAEISDAQEQVERNEIAMTISDALKMLPKEEQDVLRMCFWESRTVREIAKILGRPHTTIFDIKVRGTKKLKKIVLDRTKGHI